MDGEEVSSTDMTSTDMASTDMASTDMSSGEDSAPHSHDGYEHSHPFSGDSKPKDNYYIVDPNAHDPSEHETTHEHTAI